MVKRLENSNRVCPVCNNSYKTKSYVKRHLKNHIKRNPDFIYLKEVRRFLGLSLHKQLLELLSEKTRTINELSEITGERKIIISDKLIKMSKIYNIKRIKKNNQFFYKLTW